MLKLIRFFSFIMAAMVFLSGCGIKAKAYITRRDRVDQDVAVYPGATKVESSQQAPKKTRQIIVVEVAREKKEKQQNDSQSAVDTQPVVDDSKVASTAASNENVSTSSKMPVIHSDSMNISAAVLADPTEFVSYTVQKDDTLQKIAKQFLGSYGQWTKIYEANRDKIKDPNFLKPGVVLSIPKQ